VVAVVAAAAAAALDDLFDDSHWNRLLDVLSSITDC